MCLQATQTFVSKGIIVFEVQHYLRPAAYGKGVESSGASNERETNFFGPGIRIFLECSAVSKSLGINIHNRLQSGLGCGSLNTKISIPHSSKRVCRRCAFRRICSSLQPCNHLGQCCYLNGFMLLISISILPCIY